MFCLYRLRPQALYYLHNKYTSLRDTSLDINTDLCLPHRRTVQPSSFWITRTVKGIMPSMQTGMSFWTFFSKLQRYLLVRFAFDVISSHAVLPLEVQ